MGRPQMRGLMHYGKRIFTVSLLAALFIAVPLLSGPVQADSAEDEAAALMRAGADAIELGQFDKAAVDFSNALDSGGLTPEGRALAYHHRGVAFQKVGQQDAAIADYTRAIETKTLPPTVLARAYYNRGIAHANAGKLDEAEGDYLTAIGLTPGYAAAYHNLANLERRRHAYDDAIQHYSAAIDNMRGRERKLPLFGRALAREQTGDIERAAADLKQALALDPEFELAATKLSAISSQSEIAEEAAAPQSAESDTVRPSAPEVETAAQVMPSTLNPFQTASSGYEGGKAIQISSVGGWRTTATRFPAEPVAKAMAADQTSADEIITGSLRPTETAVEPRSVKAKAKAASGEGVSAEMKATRYRLQLGAFREPEVAARAWSEISDEATPLVGALDHAIQRADLGERGVFYRLRAGAFDGINEARAACKTLEARKIDCIVVDG